MIKPAPTVLAHVESAGYKREIAIAQIVSFLRKNPRSERHMANIRRQYTSPATQLQMLMAATIGDDIAEGIEMQRKQRSLSH